MRIALIGALLASSTLVGATDAAAVSYCSTSGGFGACASAGLGPGYGGSGPEVALRNLTGVIGDAGYVLAGFALYYAGTHLPFGKGGSDPGAIELLAPETGAGLSQSGSIGRGSLQAPLRSANSLGRNPRALARGANGNGPIGYSLSIQDGNGSSAIPELTTQLPVSSNLTDGGPGALGPAILNTTAPEPATMALMAIGLVGLAGAGYLQRRRHS